MRYSSIQVTPETRRRLAAYKTAGRSYEDVIKILMAAVPAEGVRAGIRSNEGHIGRTLAQARTVPTGSEPHGVAFQRARLATMTPGERMDEAFRLFAMARARDDSGR